MKIGILGFQGAIEEHMVALKRLGINSCIVKKKEDFDNIDGLIIPGGESTTIGSLLERYGLVGKIKKFYSQGKPIFGTCAGAILLSKEVLGNKVKNLGLMDFSVRRNSYGRQVDSFEVVLDISGIGNYRGVFIRAPEIEKVFNGATIMATFKNKPVLIKQDNLLAATFHPELTNDTRIHKFFVEMVMNRL